MIDRRRGSRSRVTTVAATPAPQGSPGVAGLRDLPGTVRVPPGPHFGDRGSASVLVALWAVVLTALASAGIVLTSVLAARVSASSAADLAALAGASATLEDPRAACARAREVAEANGVTLTECRIGGTEVWVVARAPAPSAVDWLVPGRGTHIGARAHAELAAEDP